MRFVAYSARRAGLHEKSPIARLREQKLARELFQDSIRNAVV